VVSASDQLRPTLPAVRSSLQRRVGRLRRSSVPIAQTAVAAAIAWQLASLVNPQPFFAPISAVISVGVASGRRTLRAIELVLGVALGIAVADVIVTVLGTGTLVVALVVALAMSAALLLGAGNILVNQAAVSAILVATLQPPTSGVSPNRFLDALIGGGVALLIAQVLFPRDPVKAMARAAQPVVEDLGAALEATARALRVGDLALAERALEMARAVDEDLVGFRDSITVARETMPVRPGLRPGERLPLYVEAAQRMEYAVRNTRVLARRAVASIRRHGPAPPELAEAVELLARAVRALGLRLAEPGHEVEVRRCALRAAARATSTLAGDPGLSNVVIAAQVRSTVMDLLRGSGMGDEEARRALQAATEEGETPTDVAMRTVPRPS
jgi:Fusaric acid resistance protein-like